ncbi:protein C19orf12 homolog [Montipora capricornis]|uniref:protein C19orf12 homolog n=1 Tax=Montipora capricornis TaxID=246305 RepID=UPI0035F17C5E
MGSGNENGGIPRNCQLPRNLTFSSVIVRSSKRIMPVSVVEFQRVMSILADEDQLKVTVKTSAYGGVVAGVTTTIGGLIAGPAGLLVGGAVGGMLAYKSAGNFKPVSQVINDMNAHERQLLYDAMKDIIDNLSIEDYMGLIAFLNGGPGLLIRQQLMDRMVSFLRDQMRLQMAA